MSTTHMTWTYKVTAEDVRLARVSRSAFIGRGYDPETAAWHGMVEVDPDDDGWGTMVRASTLLEAGVGGVLEFTCRPPVVGMPPLDRHTGNVRIVRKGAV